MNGEIIRLEDELREVYEEYIKNSRQINPGNKNLKDNFCKVLSQVSDESAFTQSPDSQKDLIKKLLELLKEPDEVPKMMYLYPDYLQFNAMKDLEFRNTPSKIKEELLNFFMLKFFRLSNIREKTITRSNHTINVRFKKI
jgi:hypothetical protein